MEATFEKQSFGKSLKSMFKVDFKRVFTMPLVYIMIAVSFCLPVLILVMTAFTGSGDGATSEGFTNVWQTIGSVSGTPMSMGLTGMCNINMLYFLIGIFVCIFVAEDFKSGYAKNLFTVRAKRVDYCISKTTVGFVCGAIMLVAYFVGAMIGGAIAGLPFGTGTVGAGEIVACLFSKLFLALVFVAIAFLLSVVGKQRLWLSVVGSLAVGMLLFAMIPSITPLNATILNVIMCLGGGILFGAGFGAISYVILNKTSLV